MIQDFSFVWNGRKWNGYFNAIARETIIAHFEDALIRDAVGQSVSYSKKENALQQKPAAGGETGSEAEIFAAILKGVEVRLGKPIQLYLN